MLYHPGKHRGGEAQTIIVPKLCPTFISLERRDSTADQFQLTPEHAVLFVNMDDDMESSGTI